MSSQSSHPRLRPPIPWSILAIIHMIIQIHLCAMIVAGLIIDRNDFSMAAAFVLLPFCTWLAAEQYRAIFRKVARAATTVSVLLYVVSGFLLFGLVLITVEGLVKGLVDGGVSIRSMASVQIPASIVIGLTFSMGRINALWAKHLRSLPTHEVDLRASKDIRLLELLVAIGAVAIVLGISSTMVRMASPRYREHTTASFVPFWLPNRATDVSYCMGHRGTMAYEFTIDEDGFREWFDAEVETAKSASARVSLLEITTPVEVVRYCTYASELTGPATVTVKRGLYYAWSKEDRGVYAAFDRTTGRGYYHRHLH